MTDISFKILEALMGEDVIEDFTVASSRDKTVIRLPMSLSLDGLRNLDLDVCENIKISFNDDYYVITYSK